MTARVAATATQRIPGSQARSHVGEARERHEEARPPVDQRGERDADLVDEIPGQDEDLGRRVLEQDLDLPDRNADPRDRPPVLARTAIHDEGQEVRSHANRVKERDGTRGRSIPDHESGARPCRFEMRHDFPASSLDSVPKRSQAGGRPEERVGLTIHDLADDWRRVAVRPQEDTECTTVDRLRHCVDDREPDGLGLAREPAKCEIALVPMADCVPLSALDRGQQMVELTHQHAPGRQKLRNAAERGPRILEMGKEIEVHDQIELAQLVGAWRNGFIEPASDRVKPGRLQATDALDHGIHDGHRDALFVE